MTHIASYIQALAFAVLFLVFINGSIGWALVYILLGAGLLSALTCVFSRKHFTVELKPRSEFAEYGDRVGYDVVVSKNGFCFLPFIEIKIVGSAEASVQTSLLFRRSAVVTGFYNTNRSGMNTLAVQSAALRDFWSIVRLRVPISETALVAVTPRPMEYTGPEIAVKTLPSEDEEAEEGRSVMSGGLPGYEHREYFPGDSLRRINYKLSAKKRRLMVRLDESNGLASTVLLIDGSGLSECCDLAFALARLLVMRGGTVRIIHVGDSITASTPETLAKMREWLAFRHYGNNAETAERSEVDDPTAEKPDVIFSGAGEIRVIAQSA
ncbi:MAG: DUF58 domain-containing protein [Oscillospiraceae bacterium]|nr:DUF58 domain-containing protein [Oscillospiraceae bacterium]